MDILTSKARSFIKNPRKKFNFLIEILGDPILEPFAAQQVTFPDLEIDRTEHGIGNTVKGTPGLIKTGTLKIDRIISSGPTSAFTADGFLKWMYQVQDPVHFVGGDPLIYEKVIRVIELSNNAVSGAVASVLNVTYFMGCWPIRINGKEYDRVSSDNVVESIEFSVDYMTTKPGETPTEGPAALGGQFV